MKESSPIEETRKRATIYARFSTDLQNERSIEDQLSLCQSYAEREGLTVVSTYEDRGPFRRLGHGTRRPSADVGSSAGRIL
jgi:DNA invertase Pin-like site-specific DNA recombinase